MPHARPLGRVVAKNEMAALPFLHRPQCPQRLDHRWHMPNRLRNDLSLKVRSAVTSIGSEYEENIGRCFHP